MREATALVHEENSCAMCSIGDGIGTTPQESHLLLKGMGSVKTRACHFSAPWAAALACFVSVQASRDRVDFHSGRRLRPIGVPPFPVSQRTGSTRNSSRGIHVQLHLHDLPYHDTCPYRSHHECTMLRDARISATFACGPGAAESE